MTRIKASCALSTTWTAAVSDLLFVTLFVILLRFSQHLFDYSYQLRELCLAYIENSFGIHVEILVADNISKPLHFFPINFRILDEQFAICDLSRDFSDLRQS